MAQGAKAQVRDRGAQAPQLLSAKVSLGKLSLDRAGMNYVFLRILQMTIDCGTPKHYPIKGGREG